MQPSTPFDWGRLVTPARWTARTLGVLFILFLGFGLLLARADHLEVPWEDWALLVAVVVVSLVAAFVWKGVGEVAGGLALVGYGLWVAVSVGIELTVLASTSPVVLPGALFIACGGYTLALRRHRTPSATA